MADIEKYYTQANPELLDRIPVTAKIVLEIGCGAGGLAYEYKRINPTAKYIGVELDKDAAAIARNICDEVIEGDIAKLSTKSLIQDNCKADCIVLGDVLEHLVEPKAILKRLSLVLSENGVLIMCIPNVQHWHVIANLLSGMWPQKDEGLFDRTHLRWFTKNSILELTKEVGLNVDELVGRRKATKESIEFVKTLKPALQCLNSNVEEMSKQMECLQYVVRATKKNCNSMIISGLMLKPQAAMNDVRMIQPLQSLQSLPGIKVNASSGYVSMKTLVKEIPKIMIWQRQLLRYDDDSLKRIKTVIDNGYILISEFDDDPDHWPAIAQNKNLNFRGVHAVQVSTSLLKQKLLNSNPEVQVFENCLYKLPHVAESKWHEIGTKRPIRIFFGALNRKSSWSEWIPQINRIIDNHGDKWEFEVIHDLEFFNQLKTKSKIFTPTCQYSEYIKKMASCHICLLPLEHSQFNKFKSDLKFVESAGCETLAIASPTVYENTIIDKETGHICMTASDVYEILLESLDDPDSIKRIASNARAWCQENRMQYQQTKSRLDWYQYLWSKREELNEKLMERIPELNNI